MSDNQNGKPTSIGATQEENTGLQRRQMLRSIAASASLAALGSTLLTACGGGGDSEQMAAAAGDKQALGGPKAKYDTPTIGCVSATENTISITAGASGAPAGFSVQWMSCADFAANNNTWYSSDDARLCKASFSGNANGSQWDLGANGVATLVIGGLNDTDPGVSFTRNGLMTCETCYVFRAFAHATSKAGRSDFSADTQCNTAACKLANLVDGAFCTKSQGFLGTNAGPSGGAPNNGSWGAITCALNVLGGLAVIGGSNRSATFTTIAAIVGYLPNGGTSGPLTGTTTDSAPAGGGNLAAQTLTLTLNIALSGSGCTEGTCAATGYPAGYGSVKLCHFSGTDTWQNNGAVIGDTTAAALNGQTVSEVLAAANAYLNGGPLPYALTTPGQLNELVNNLNLAFDAKDTTVGSECACGVMSSFAQSHLCPG